MVAASRAASCNQSECFTSAFHNYATLKFVDDISSMLLFSYEDTSIDLTNKREHQGNQREQGRSRYWRYNGKEKEVTKTNEFEREKKGLRESEYTEGEIFGGHQRGIFKGKIYIFLTIS